MTGPHCSWCDDTGVDPAGEVTPDGSCHECGRRPEPPTLSMAVRRLEEVIWCGEPYGPVVDEIVDAARAEGAAAERARLLALGTLWRECPEPGCCDGEIQRQWGTENCRCRFGLVPVPADEIDEDQT